VSLLCRNPARQRRNWRVLPAVFAFQLFLCFLSLLNGRLHFGHLMTGDPLSPTLIVAPKSGLRPTDSFKSAQTDPVIIAQLSNAQTPKNPPALIYLQDKVNHIGHQNP
jgi:hypothetical protein